MTSRDLHGVSVCTIKNRLAVGRGRGQQSRQRQSFGSKGSGHGAGLAAQPDEALLVGVEFLRCERQRHHGDASEGGLQQIGEDRQPLELPPPGFESMRWQGIVRQVAKGGCLNCGQQPGRQQRKQWARFKGHHLRCSPLACAGGDVHPGSRAAPSAVPGLWPLRRRHGRNHLLKGGSHLSNGGIQERPGDVEPDAQFAR